MNTFERDGISFRFPADIGPSKLMTTWKAEGGLVAVTSSGYCVPDGVAATGGIGRGRPRDQALDSPKSEYKDFDAENVMETICGLPAIGFNADFLNTWTRPLSVACAPSTRSPVRSCYSRR